MWLCITKRRQCKPQGRGMLSQGSAVQIESAFKWEALQRLRTKSSEDQRAFFACESRRSKFQWLYAAPRVEENSVSLV